MPEKRKIRPIACAEVLVKLGEGIDVDRSYRELAAAYKDVQFGCGFPDAAPFLIYVVRTWAQAAEKATDLEAPVDQETGEAQDDQAVLAVDSKNAYGSMFRSVMLRAAKARTPLLASRQATQWSVPTRLWVNEGGKWVMRTTNRGGWQGSQQMMHMFAMGL